MATLTRKIKILAVIPYAGLDSIIKNQAMSFDNVFEITYIYAQLSDAVAAIAQYVEQDFDAVVSRGGTAKLLAHNIKIPVFDIGISTNDFINTYTLARNANLDNMCIVAFKEVANSTKYLEKLIDKPIKVYEITQEIENDTLMSSLKEQGVQLIIGDATSTKYAKKHGINNILVTSGEDSVKDCFNRILKYINDVENTVFLNTILKTVIKNNYGSFLVFNSNKQVVHTQISADTISKIDIDNLKKYSALMISKKIDENIDNHIYSINQKLFRFSISQEIVQAKIYYIVYCRSLLTNESQELILLDKVNYPFEVASLSTNSTDMAYSINEASKYSKLKNPIIILGEERSGRGALAHEIYKQSTYASEAFYVLNAKVLDLETVDNLFINENSILLNPSITLVVRNILNIAENIREKLFNIIYQSEFYKRSRLILIIDNESNSNNCNSIRKIISQFDFLVLTVPPLSKRKDDIIFLATIALSEFSTAMGKTFSGFSKGACNVLLNHTWPGNLSELRWYMRQIVASKQEGEYIQEDEILNQIKIYENLYGQKSYRYKDLLNGTLEEIESRIIQLLIHEQNGNKSAVAQKLGISRNTLYKFLK